MSSLPYKRLKYSRNHIHEQMAAMQVSSSHLPQGVLGRLGATNNTNELKLNVGFRTNKSVHLIWDAGIHRAKLDDYPFKLKYQKLPQQIGMIQVPVISMPDSFYTQSTIDLPGEKYKSTVFFIPGESYRFTLQAQLKNTASFIYGVADIKMADGPCHETIDEILQSPDFLKRFCILVDPNRQLHQIIANKFGVSREAYKQILYYKDPDNHPVTERLLNTICELCEDEENIKICHLLRVVKEHGTKQILKELFEWHTGRTDGKGPCNVCTRDQFG